MVRNRPTVREETFVGRNSCELKNAKFFDVFSFRELAKIENFTGTNFR